VPRESKGVLYIVATPIGNLDDITLRALKILKQVELVAAEDTRRTGILLRHFGIETAILSVHEHNERARVERIVSQLGKGQSVALVTDAGTPGISDPGAALGRRHSRSRLPGRANSGSQRRRRRRSPHRAYHHKALRSSDFHQLG
jgi:16S rRNA (cytidine1402-2'-O)-methyltransferase